MSASSSPSKQSKSNSLAKLHNQLLSQLEKKSSNSSISQTLNSYAQLLIRQDKNTRQLFDACCELGFYDLLQKIFVEYHLIVTQTICLLLVNLQHQQSIAFLLSHPIMTDIIAYPQATKQQNIEYYISTMKTLSQRINTQNLALFYNQKHFRFPLAEISSKFYNHPESLIRTSSMNIIFTLMKIPSKNLNKFFSSFPFNILYLHLVCYVRSRWIEIDEALIKGDTRAKDLLQDQKDFVMSLQDILDLEHTEINTIIRHCILVYLIKPILKSLLLPSKGQVSMVLGLYLLLDYLSIFQQQKDLVEFVCTCIFSESLSPMISQTLMKQTYIPKSYSFNNVNSYLFDNFENEINQYYKSLISPQVLDKIIPNQNLLEQLQKIKDNVGYDLLKCEKDDQFWFYQDKGNSIEGSTPNTIREIIYSLLKTKDDLMLQLVTKVIIFFCTNKHLQKHMLLTNHLLLYKDAQIQHHQQLVKQCVKQVNQNYQNIKSISIIYLLCLQSQMLFRTQTLQSILFLLHLLLNRHPSHPLSNEQKQILKQSFTKTLNQLRSLCKSQSKYLIVNYLEKVIQQLPLHTSKYSTPNFESLQIETENHEIIIEQLVLKFYCLLKLRYYYIKQTKNTHKSLHKFAFYYKQKFQNQSSQWKQGRQVLILNRSLVQCYNITLKTKVIIVSDNLNFIIVKEKQGQVEVQILVNAKYKYITASIEQQTNLKIIVQNKKQTYKLQLQSQYLAKKVYQNIIEAKEINVNQQTKFLLGYLQQCLNDL